VTEGDASVLQVLRNQAFLRLWLVQGLSQTAQNMINFSLLVLVRQIVETQRLSGANTAISLLVLAFSVPAVIVSPIAGVIVERADKRTVMAISNGLRSLAVLAFLALDPHWEPVATLTALYVITFFFGAVGQFFGPAQAAAIPVIVRPRELLGANALFNLTFTGSQILGFATLGPLAIKLWGVEHTLIGILVLYIGTTALATLVPSTPPQPRASDPTTRHPFRQLMGEAREGVVLVMQRPVLIKAIAYLTLATTTYLMIASLGPAFISNILGLSSEDIAYVVAPAGLGVVAGALVVNKFTARFAAARLIDYGLVAAGLSLAAFALTEPVGRWLGFADAGVSRGIIIISVSFAACLGVSNAFILIPSQTLLQRAAPEHSLARVYATYFTISNTASFVPVLFAGAFADLFGVLKVMVVIALLLTLTGLVNLRRAAPELPDTSDNAAVEDASVLPSR
jgi:MFS family permease